MLCRPDEPAAWEAPGLPDSQAGAWPGRVARIVARITAGLVMPQFKEDRLPLVEAFDLLDEALAEAPEDARPAAPARMGPIEVVGASARDGALIERECVICMSEPREVRFSCGHAVCCRQCAESLLALGHPCPTCRSSDITTADVGVAVNVQPTYVQQRRGGGRADGGGGRADGGGGRADGGGGRTVAAEPAGSVTPTAMPPQLPSLYHLGRGRTPPSSSGSRGSLRGVAAGADAVAAAVAAADWGDGGGHVEWSGVDWGAARQVMLAADASPELPPPPSASMAVTPPPAMPAMPSMEGSRGPSPPPLQPLPASWVPSDTSSYAAQLELEPVAASPPVAEPLRPSAPPPAALHTGPPAPTASANATASGAATAASPDWQARPRRNGRRNRRS